MRLPEQRFWDRCRPRLNRNGLFSKRVENLVDVGFPDVVVQCDTGLTRFVELKAIAAWPVRDSTPVLGKRKGLNPDQVGWHIAWRAAGGFTGILVGIGGTEQFYFDGSHARFVNSYTLKDFQRNGVFEWQNVRCCVRIR